jgi:hypothetical protein
MRRAWLAFSFLLVLPNVVACSNHGGKKPPMTAPSGDEEDGGASECIDSDGDGYGRYCGDGPDCDDTDPDKHVGCCIGATTGCECKAGTAPKSCKPDNKVIDGGVYMCTEGTRYCRDGFWSKCEAVGDYVFVGKAN